MIELKIKLRLTFPVLSSQSWQLRWRFLTLIRGMEDDSSFYVCAYLNVLAIILFFPNKKSRKIENLSIKYDAFYESLKVNIWETYSPFFSFSLWAELIVNSQTIVNCWSSTFHRSFLLIHGSKNGTLINWRDKKKNRPKESAHYLMEAFLCLPSVFLTDNNYLSIILYRVQRCLFESKYEMDLFALN